MALLVEGDDLFDDIELVFFKSDLNRKDLHREAIRDFANSFD